MSRALEEILILDDDIGAVHRGVHVAELQVHHLGDVSVPPFLLGVVHIGR